ncbi:hypothetical protein VULLAG_LOCUS19728 [Vulpes lagopus]
MDTSTDGALPPSPIRARLRAVPENAPCPPRLCCPPVNRDTSVSHLQPGEGDCARAAVTGLNPHPGGTFRLSPSNGLIWLRVASVTDLLPDWVLSRHPVSRAGPRAHPHTLAPLPPISAFVGATPGSSAP